MTRRFRLPAPVKFYQALVRNKVPAELHTYPKGRHGWGFTDLGIGLDPKVCKDNLGSCRPEFSAALERWLGQQLEGVDGKKDSRKSPGSSSHAGLTRSSTSTLRDRTLTRA